MKIKPVFDFLLLIAIGIGMLLLIYGYIALTIPDITRASILFTVGWGMITFALALYSIFLARDSDEKMKSIVNAEFLQAINMLEDARIEFIKTLDFIQPVVTVGPQQTTRTPSYSPELYTWKTKSSIEMAVEFLKRDKQKNYIEPGYQDKLFHYFNMSFNHFFKYPNWKNEEKSMNHLVNSYAQLENYYNTQRKKEFIDALEGHLGVEGKKDFLVLVTAAKTLLFS
jgi:hypothetical protein